MESPVRYGRAPGALPLIGHAHQFMRDPLPFLVSLPRHGELVRIRLGIGSALVVCDPALARHVLREDRVFDRAGPVTARVRDVLGNGLASCPHSDHRRQRRLLQAAFRRDRMPGYARIMVEQIDGAVGSWRETEGIDVPARAKELSTFVLASAMLGGWTEPGAVRQIVADFGAVTTIALARTVLPRAGLRLLLAAERRHARASERLRNAVVEAIGRARAGGADRGDLLSMLVRGDTESGDVLSDAEIVDQIYTFFVAGVDTTASLIASTVHLVAHDPALQKAVSEEAADAVAGGPLTYDRLSDLPLTGRVVSEALRLYPPGWVIARYTAVDTELGGHHIPAGTFVIASPYLVQRDPAAYDRPQDSDPDRWLTGTRAGREAFIPFGTGARKCIGDEFARVQAVLALAAIVGRWQVRPVTGPDYVPRCTFNLRPASLRVTVAPRSQVVRPAGCR